MKHLIHADPARSIRLRNGLLSGTREAFLDTVLTRQYRNMPQSGPIEQKSQVHESVCLKRLDRSTGS